MLGVGQRVLEADRALKVGLFVVERLGELLLELGLGGGHRRLDVALPLVLERDLRRWRGR